MKHLLRLSIEDTEKRGPGAVLDFHFYSKILMPLSVSHL